MHIRLGESGLAQAGQTSMVVRRGSALRGAENSQRTEPAVDLYLRPRRFGRDHVLVAERQLRTAVVLTRAGCAHIPDAGMVKQRRVGGICIAHLDPVASGEDLVELRSRKVVESRTLYVATDSRYSPFPSISRS